MTDEPVWEQVARKVAARWTGSSLPYDDVLQCARLGAWQSAQRFDPNYGHGMFQWCWNRAMGAVQDAHRKNRGVRRCRNGEGEIVESRRLPDTFPVAFGTIDEGAVTGNTECFTRDEMDPPFFDITDEWTDLEALVTSLAATHKERYLLTAIAMDQSQADVARHFGLSESRVSQMMRDLRQRAINLGVTV